LSARPRGAFGFEPRADGSQSALDGAGFARSADRVRVTLDIVQFPAFARWSEMLRQQRAPLGLALRTRPMHPDALGQTVFAQRDSDLT